MPIAYAYVCFHRGDLKQGLNRRRAQMSGGRKDEDTGAKAMFKGAENFIARVAQDDSGGSDSEEWD